MRIINSIQRILQIVRLYLGENMNTEFVFWAIVTFLFTVLDHRNFVIFVLYLSAVVRTLQFRKRVLYGVGAVRFQMLPAAIHEKLAALVVINSLYHFAMTCIAYCLGNLLIYLIYHLILKIQIPINWDLFSYTNTILIDGVIHASIKNVFFSLFGHFALAQGILLTGMLYFRRFSLLKTLLAVLGTITGIAALQVFLFKALWDVEHLSNAILPSIIMLQNNTLPNAVNTIVLYGAYVLLPFVWLSAYFRMKENTH